MTCKDSENPKQTETKQKIIDAVTAILDESNLDDLTVAGVAKRSGIHRSTFYRYFDNLNKPIYNAMLQQAPKTDASDPMAASYQALTYIAAHQNFWRNVIAYQQTAHVSFQFLIEQLVADIFGDEILKTSPATDLFCYYTIGSAFESWINHTNEISVSQFQTFIIATIHSLLATGNAQTKKKASKKTK